MNYVNLKVDYKALLINPQFEESYSDILNLQQQHKIIIKS